MTDLERRLINFALDTLLTLESDEGWSSDTTDAIDAVAMSYGLRSQTKHGYFCRTRSVKDYSRDFNAEVQS